MKNKKHIRVLNTSAGCLHRIPLGMSKTIMSYLFIIIFCFVDTCHAQSKTKVFDEQLKMINHNVLEMSYFEINNDREGEAFKILILGNSLAHCGIFPDLGWLYAAGMAASEIEKDYVHLLLRMTDSIMPEKRIDMKIIPSMFAFERNLTTFDFSVFDHFASFQPDLIIIQIGENVGFNEIQSPEVFREKYISLIRYLKQDRHPPVICTTSFFPSATKNRITQQVALATKSYLVDLSHLALSDERNYAKNEDNYPGDKSAWKVDGIGFHPGDLGMKNVAQQIFTVINALCANQKK